MFSMLLTASSAGLIYNYWHSATMNGRLHIENLLVMQNNNVLVAIEKQMQQITTNINTVVEMILNDPNMIEDEIAVQNTLRILATNTAELSTLSVADDSGNYYSLFRPESNNLLMYAHAKSDGVMLSGAFDLWRNKPSSLEVNKGFFVTERPWYVQAVNSEGLNWTSVYEYHASGSSAIGASQAIDLKGGKQVVVAADYLLNGLDGMLNQIGSQHLGVLLLLDHQKNIIADSVYEENNKHRLFDKLMQDKQLLMDWLDDTQVQIKQLGDLIISKQFVDLEGRDDFWLVNAISESQMLSDVYNQSMKLVWVSVVILVIAILLSYTLAKLMLGPVVKLEHVSKQIASGHWDTDIPSSYIKEINHLSGAYLVMAQEIKSTLDNLESQVNRRTLRLQKLNDQLKQSNLTDPLTRIPNRRFFNQKMDAFYENHRTVFLAIVDVDYFKKFNDKFGHLVGDQALILIATVIKQHCATADTYIARIGGEEFAVIHIGDHVNFFKNQLASLQLRINQQPLDIAEMNIRETLTVSIGASRRKTAETDWEDLYRRADDSLYQAKAKGRNCLVFENV